MTKSDYDSYFLPFELASHSRLAPAVEPHHSTEGSCQSQEEGFDNILNSSDVKTGRPERASTALRQFFPDNTTRGLYQPKVTELIDTLQGSSQHPVDLTDEKGAVERFRTEDLLDAVIIRHLHFAEDVRPPYSGSYTKIASPRQASKLRRAPFSRTRTDTNYDYDSEAEWEEPEEGEDISSDEEDDAESVASADEMEGFLDDEDAVDAAKARRRLITTDLEPVSTGICWDDGLHKDGVDRNETGIDLGDMRLGWLIGKTNSREVENLADMRKMPQRNRSIPSQPRIGNRCHLLRSSRARVRRYCRRMDDWFLQDCLFPLG